MKRIFLFLLCFSLWHIYLHAQIKVTVNSTKWVEFPLVKKIGVYQTPLVSREWISRDVPKLNELEVRSMRYEMACGKDDLYGQPCVSGSADKLSFAYTDIDYFLTLARKYAPVLVISHGYTPTILQRRPKDKRPLCLPLEVKGIPQQLCGDLERAGLDERFFYRNS